MKNKCSANKLTREQDIRAAIMHQILYTTPVTNVFHEFVLGWGVKRIDIAIINQEHTVGYEIKSDLDTIKRLPEQSAYFEKFFDYCYLVVSPKHLEKSLTIIPPEWGIYIAQMQLNNVVDLNQLREASLSKNLNAKTMLGVIWKQELLEILGLKIAVDWRTRKLTCNDLREKIIELFSIDEIRDRVRYQLTHRDSWRKK